ncbi:phage tail protein [Algibacter amylolyticus]|nr:tail fiber protein [Algibacter amylolyticus]MBB5268240.1 microcystin-dependent protein [Algibacter amylolyticus]
MKLKIKIMGLLMFCLLTSMKSKAQEGFIGEVKMFAGSFVPRNWAFCQGQLLSIASNTALFSIIGTTYGGGGRTTFALTDLRSRTAVGAGAGPGLSNIREGSQSGSEDAILTILNMPIHNHAGTFTQTSGISTMPAVAEEANSDDPTNNSLAIPNIGGANRLYSSDTPDTNLSNGTGNVQGSVNIFNRGSQQPFNIRNPYLGINYIICTKGIFPSRS